MDLQPAHPQHQSPPSPLPRVPHVLMHKSRLQQYIQKSALPLPSYHTVTEGFPQATRFRSTVLVDGIEYKSQAFFRRKEAEHDAAKVALESIMKKIKDEACPLILEDMGLCKSILNEFAVKMSLTMPTYETNRSQGCVPLFISTLVFHGKKYTGSPARTKKEAEQLAARNVIQLILGSESGPVLSQIVNTKRKFCVPHLKVNDNNVPPVVPFSNFAQVTNVPETPMFDQAFKKPKLENACETNTGSVGNVTPILNQLPCADHTGLTGVQGIIASTSGKKNPKKKNKKKGHNEILIDGRLQPGAYPMIHQPSPCSVAQ